MIRATIRAAPPTPTCIALLRAQAAATPDKVAVEWPGGTLHYAALVQRIDGLAMRLRQAGIAPGQVVGVGLPHGLEMVLALFAIHRCGAVFLPLDPDYPAERLRIMLEDSQPALVLVTAATVALFAGRRQLRTDLESGPADASLAGPTAGHRLDDALPEDAAAILFTSGSTGRPKGVVVTQRGLAHNLGWLTLPPYQPGWRTLHVITTNFVMGLGEILTPLASGGTLVIAPAALRRDAPALARFIADHAIDDVQVPVGVLLGLAEAVALADPHLAGPHLAIRRVITGGEALRTTPALRALFTACPEARLINAIGPTECSVVASIMLPKAVADWPALPPIGLPVAGQSVYLLDADLAPVPVGELGELVVGGTALAQGYLNQPALTAEKFVADPFGPPGARMYRTGDLVRQAADGTLSFAGRRDFQLKIRGHRVEAGEVEAALLAEPAIIAAAVLGHADAGGNIGHADTGGNIGHADNGGNARLVAYLVARAADARPSRPMLRAALGRTLPDWMIPSSFTWLDALPLLPNGKLDRARLPAPDHRRDIATAYRAPATAAERIIADLFADIIGLDEVGAEDDFFALGGDSIQAMAVIAGLHRAGFRLSLARLFEAPTPGRLAESLVPVQSAAAPALPAGHLPVTPLQPVILDALEHDRRTRQAGGQGEPGAAWRPIWLVQIVFVLRGRLDIAALRQSWRGVLDRHPGLRATFRRGPDGEHMVVAASHPVAASWRESLAVTGPPVPLTPEMRLDGDLAEPFDLAAGPLCRMRLVARGPDEFLLVFTNHHIIADGWSIGLIFDELFAGYAAHLSGSRLTAPAPSWDGYAHWLATRDRATARLFWQQEFAGFTPPATPLPRGGAMDEQHCLLEGAPLEACLRFLRSQRITLGTLIQGTWALLLARRSGQRDVAFTVIDAARPGEVADIAQLVGLLMALVPVRAQITGQQPVGAWLQAQQMRQAAATDHGHLGLPAIAEAAGQNASALSETLVVVVDRLPAGRQLFTGDGWSGHGLAAEFINMTDHADEPLTLTVCPTSAGTHLWLAYDEAVCDAAAAMRLLAEFCALLARLTADPAQTLEALLVPLVGVAA